MSNSAAAIPLGRLPKKEGEIFKNVISCYETKQYRKGIKHAENILKKFPNHGETLAMKGLIVKQLGKRDEAYELVKAGLKNDVRSHICWHVFGLIYKSDNNLKEASKCYLNALRIDPSNQNILRDLSFLQIQIRDINGFVTTRAKIAQMKPGIRSSWVGYAVASYIAGNYKVAGDLISTYYKGVEELSDPYYESEFLMFQNRCLEKEGNFREAILHLERNESKIVDRLAMRTRLAELTVLSGRFNEARVRWTFLVNEQPENYRFHAGLQTAYLQLDPAEAALMFTLKELELPSTTLNLSDEQLETLKEVYQKEQFGKSRASRKIYLTFLRGEELRTSLEQHIRKNLSDAVPALYQDVCSLIRTADSANPQKIKFVKDSVDFKANAIAVIALEVVERLIRNLRSNGTFDATPAEDVKLESPSALLWALFLYSHLLELRGDFERAFETIEECIQHTPTALDVICKKAHLLKKVGAYREAAQTVDYSRSLDLQDRFLNNKATKYLLRADQMQQAMDTIALFTKHDGDPQRTLYDLQCNWYELEAAESYARTKQWGQALKKFYAVQSHFQMYLEDMYEFHHFCVRKNTLRVYADILNMQDKIYSHKFFQRASRGAITILLHLIDSPEDIDGLGHLTAAERKKEKARLKKKKEREQKEFEEKEKEAEKEANDSDKEPTSPDDDPFGDKLLARNFLEEAAKWVALLSPVTDICDPDTLAVACEVALRRSKFIPAMRILSTGLRKHPNHPALSYMLVKFAQKVGGGCAQAAGGGNVPAHTKTTIQNALKDELSGLMGPGDAVAFANRYAITARSVGSLPHRIAAARALLASSKSAGSKTAAAALLTEEEVWASRGVTVEVVVEAYQVLANDLKLDADAAAFKDRATQLFPKAEAFKTTPIEEPSAVVAEATEAST